MSRRRQSGNYYERNGIAYTSSRGWNSDTFIKRDTAMNAADVNQALIARLENEIGLLKGALNLSRVRAEDAEADLAEARLDLAQESHRADDAELERDNARVEAMGLAWDLDELRDAIDKRKVQVAVTWIAPPAAPRGLASLPTAGEHATPHLASVESTAVAEIAAKLVAVMAENERVAALSPAVVPALQRESKLIAPNGSNAREFAPKTPIPVRQTPFTIDEKHQYALKSFLAAQNEAKVKIISKWAANQGFLQHHWEEQSEAHHAALERISLVSAPNNTLVAADAAIPF